MDKPQASINDKPVSATIKKQVHETSPTTSDSTLVDDSTALVGDSTALVGGQTTSLPVTRSTIKVTVPSGKI